MLPLHAKEQTMNTTDLFPATTQLHKGEIHRLGNGQGLRIEALSGNLWITIDRDIRDILLKPGEAFDIDRPGQTLISALDDSRFAVLDPA
jgi:hypothetical protein